MPAGPGKYDDLCTHVRERSGARKGAIVIVLDGDQGDGFSVQAPPESVLILPGLLRTMADEIERSLRN